MIGIASGAFIGFYAFIGFEDLVNMAEEVREPRRNLPRAILISVGATTILYAAVSLVAVLAVPPEELARASTPFAEVVGGVRSRTFLVVVSLLTGINGALVQIIMASRVAYGLAARRASNERAGGLTPRWLADVHPRTRTPVKATALMTGITLALGLSFDLVTLAEATSTIMLVVFALLNISLLIIKRRGEPAPEGAPCYSALLPALGLGGSIAVLSFQLLAALIR